MTVAIPTTESVSGIIPDEYLLVLVKSATEFATKSYDELADDIIEKPFASNPFLEGNAGKVLAINAAGNKIIVIDAPGGLNEAQVDARIVAEVLNWAHAGNTDLIPIAKIPDSDGYVTFPQVGTTRTIANTGTTTFTDVNSAHMDGMILIELVYEDDRIDEELGFSGIVTKAKIASNNGYRMQLQGLGSAHIHLQFNADNQLTATPSNLGSGSNRYTGLSASIHNVRGRGPKGDAGTLPGGGVNAIVALTQAEYNALTTKVATTLYLITG